MTRLTIRIWLATVLLTLTAAPGSLPAAQDDANQQMADAGRQAIENANNFFNLVSAAIKGGEVGAEARQMLLTGYVYPALLGIVILIIGYVVARFIGRTAGSVITRRVDVTLGTFLGRAITNGLLVLVGISALSYVGVDVTSFAAILAALGFAIGMALQGTMANVAAGVMLLVFRPFKVADYVEVGGTEGKVEAIDLFTTRMNTFDNRHLILPNGKVFGNIIQNFSRNPTRRVEVDVGTDYGADLRTTRQTLETAVAGVSRQVDPENAQVCLVSLGDSAVNWQCRVWSETANVASVKEELTEAVKYALDRDRIGIPFPQLDVNVNQG